jgi:hypothetical protein
MLWAVLAKRARCPQLEVSPLLSVQQISFPEQNGSTEAHVYEIEVKSANRFPVQFAVVLLVRIS